jgi:hypothetical protein
MQPDQRIVVLERRVRALTVALFVAIAAFAVISVRAQPGITEHLRVRQITVVDAKGTERIWIGAPVPEPIVQGKRLKRSDSISGVVLLDGNGNERAGFATSDGAAEVFIGLDSERAQEARFIVNREGGGHLTFFDDDKNYARIGISRGLPTLVLRRKGETIFEQPNAK